jgi:FtsZ-binding cell division protein ZapB
MTDQELGTNRNERLVAGYRGELVYSQEEGYKLITMTVDLYPDEQSRVTSHIYNLPLLEEAEHIPADPPLKSVDVYRFPATDGTNVILSIESQEAKYTAVYSVRENDIQEHTASLQLNILDVSERETLSQESQTAQEWKAALDEALTYYKDEIPGWLNEQDQLDTTVQQFHDHTIDFDR